MSSTRRCNWCAWPLRPDQVKFCSRECTRLSSQPKAARTLWQPEDLKPHGGSAAWRRHYRRGEPPCIECRMWNSQNHKKNRRKAAAS
jgi:hypothetical protein